MGGVVVIPADLVVATTGLLALFGGGVKWLVNRMDRKFAKVEKRYAILRVAFQMVANELARLEPNNPVLHQAQNALLREYGEPIFDATFDSLLGKIQ